MKRICKNCQYFRDGKWCSNFQSINFRYSYAVDVFVNPQNTCQHFTEYGKKAPWWMRLANWTMGGRSK